MASNEFSCFFSEFHCPSVQPAGHYGAVRPSAVQQLGGGALPRAADPPFTTATTTTTTTTSETGGGEQQGETSLGRTDEVRVFRSHIR